MNTEVHWGKLLGSGHLKESDRRITLIWIFHMQVVGMYCLSRLRPLTGLCHLSYHTLHLLVKILTMNSNIFSDAPLCCLVCVQRFGCSAFI
jgi:hypothetical protein